MTLVQADTAFWAKVQQEGDCWVWVGTRYPGGYGRFCFRGRDGGAHRWSYENMRAEIPAGLDLDHLCRNRACVNPWHLEPVTRQVNLLRGKTIPAMEAGRDSCSKGHPYAPGNFTMDQGKRRCLICRRAVDRKRRPGSVPPPAERTNCPAGHAYDEANTYVDAVGSRHCRECRREASRRAYLKRKGRAA